MIARLLAIALACCVGLSAQSQPLKTPEVPKAAKRPVTTDAGKTDNASNNQDHPQPPISITVTQPKPDPEQLQRERSDREREIAIQEAIGVYTGGLVWIGAFQLLLILVTVIYTGRAASAAKASADVAERSLVATQRAFVSIAPHANPLVIDGVRSYVFKMMFSNEGNTPALDAINYFGIVESAQSLPTPNDIFGPGHRSNGTFISPKSKVSSALISRAAHSVHGPDQIAIEQGIAIRPEKWFCLVGWTAFRDVFGRPHAAQFCYRLVSVDVPLTSPQESMVKAIGRGDVHFTFEQIGDLNRVDEDCQLHDRIIALLPARKPRAKADAANN